MKTIAAIALLAINLLSQPAAADCHKKGPDRPQYPIQMVEHLLTAGYVYQELKSLGGGETFIYSEKRNPNDANCFVFDVKNNGAGSISVDSVGAMDAWLRELVACEHGGASDYGTMHYNAHYTCV